MSTRAMYTFRDNRETFHVYKHHDGYPYANKGKDGGLAYIKRALEFAWKLPRFKAAEFAAAFVAANKESISDAIKRTPSLKQYFQEGGTGGDISLMPQGTINDVRHGDLAYRYEIEFREGTDLHIQVFECSWGSEMDTLAFEGSLTKALKHFAAKEKAEA